MARHRTSTTALDSAELEWWRVYGEVEERYCWVQPEPVQHLLRDHYVATIADDVRAGDRVLEVGCGTGWLSILLARRGVSLTGLDFSADQIERARRAVDGTGLAVDFAVGSPAELAADGERFDVVVMHAFLHHLATEEIRALLADVAGLLAEGGRLHLVEPVVHPAGRTEPTRPERALFRLEHLPLVLSNRRLRRMSEDEALTRELVQRRGDGISPPFGPSPKETAFVHDELVALLAETTRIESRTPVASMTFRVAEQLLLAELSQPRLWSVARGPVLRLARRLDRSLVGAPAPLRDVWIFEHYRCSAPPETVAR